MTATQLIRELDDLPAAERRVVVRYAKQLDASEPLSGAELGGLAQQMVDAKDPAEAARLKAQIIQGFYGTE